MSVAIPLPHVGGQAVGFLNHFGLESAHDLTGLKELREAGLLDARAMPGAVANPEEADEVPDGQPELFGDRVPTAPCGMSADSRSRAVLHACAPRGQGRVVARS